MKYCATSFFTLISVGTFLYISGSVTNSSRAPKLRDPIQHLILSSSNCSVSAVAYFIFNPKEISSEKLSANIEQINMMFETVFDSSLDHCGKLLVVSGMGASVIESFGLSIKVEVLQVDLPKGLRNLHYWNLAWYMQWYYLRYFANTNVIFLDTDTLLTYKDLTYFFDNTWDFAIAATPHNNYDTLLNVGVMMVDRNSIKKVEPLFFQIHQEVIAMAVRKVSGILNQRATLSVLSRFGDKKIERVGKIKLKKRRYIIRNSCIMVQLFAGQTEPIRVRVLNYYEWNTVPEKVASYSKIIHFRGNRKKKMKQYFLKMRKLKQDFVSDMHGVWCTRYRKVEMCKVYPYVSNGTCKL